MCTIAQLLCADTTRRSNYQKVGETGVLISLLTLTLGSNSLDGNLPGSWSAWGSIGLLDLGFNSFSGDIPPEYSRLVSLNSFSVASNSLTGGVSHVLQIPTLAVLDVSGNRLSGPVSFVKKVGNSMAHLKLSRNGFDSSVVRPSEFVLNSKTRETLLLVDLRDATFGCPFPTSADIAAAGNAGPSIIILHDMCETNYSQFLLTYCIPILAAIVGVIIVLKIGVWCEIKVAKTLTNSKGERELLAKFSKIIQSPAL